MTDNKRPVQRRPVRGQAAPARPGARPMARPAGLGLPRPGGGAMRPRRQGRALPAGFWAMAGVGAAAILLGLLLQGLLPNGFPLRPAGEAAPAATTGPAPVAEIHGDGPIRINEIMTANGGVLVDAEGNTPDWVEVANVSGRPVSLEGYVLARRAKAGNVFVFPALTLQPDECVVVYADGHLQAQAGAALRAPFRLSAAGDVLMLFNAADVAVDTVNIPALAQNEAYVRRDRNTWAADARSTPGLPNTEESYAALTTVTQPGAVQIVEIVSSTTRYGADENGVCHDYILLRNAGAEAADLSGWCLSDDVQLLRAWQFPQGTEIPANGTLLVHASGESRTENPAHLHASFRLSSEGEQVALSDADGRPVDIVTFGLLKTDTAYIRGADGDWSVGTPTAP